MPDWINYSFNYQIGTSTDIGPSYVSPAPLTETQIQEQYEEFLHEQERSDLIYEQMWEGQREREVKKLEQERRLQEDKENYPLLFLKEGIV